jgi:hypothetical protein
LLHDSNASSVGLEEVKQFFANWRKERKSRRQPIPDFLWKAAGQLFPRYPLGVIARELSLNYNLFKSKFQESEIQSPSKKKDASSLPSPKWEVTKIISVPTEPPKTSPMDWELSSPGGWTLRSFQTLHESQVEAFARGLLNAGGK